MVSMSRPRRHWLDAHRDRAPVVYVAHARQLTAKTEAEALVIAGGEQAAATVHDCGDDAHFCVAHIERAVLDAE